MTVQTNDTLDRDVISGTGPYPFSFRIFADTDLSVTALESGEVDPATLMLDTDYTVSGVNSVSGGSITLTATAATTYSGFTLDIRSNVPRTQPTSIKNQGSFLPVIHETAFDRLSRQIQDIYRQLRQAFRYPDNVDIDAAMSNRSSWLSRYLFVNASGEIEPASNIVSVALTQTLIGQTLYPRTAAEIAAGVTPSSYSRDPGPPYYDVTRLGAVQDGTDQTSIVNSAILAVAGTQTLGTSGGTVYVPMGVVVTITSLVLKKNVTVIIETGQERIVLSTGFNVSGAVNENWFSSQLHPAVIVDAHDDLTGPALGAGQVLSYRCSYLWAANRTTYWQYAMDIDAVKSKDLTLYANNSSRQLMHFNHAAGSIRYGRRSSIQDFTAPIFAHTLCQNTAVVGDDTADLTFALVQLQSGVKEDTATVTHQKLFQLDHTSGELVIVDDAATSIIWRLSNAGRVRSAQGIGGGSFTTAQRNAFTGLVSADRGIMVYDTTLTKPVWLDSVGPLVWHDATGAAV